MMQIAPPIAALPVDRLWHGVLTLDTEFGMERSVRICHQAVLGDRFLLSFAMHPLLEERSTELKDLIETLETPRVREFPISELLNWADFIHFGYEHTGHASIFKLYFETLREPLFHGELNTRFLAIKWQAGQASKYVVSRYQPVRVCSYVELNRTISSVYRENAQLPSQRFVTTVLRDFHETAPIQDVRYLEVTERQNRRRSFDLNVADLDLHVADTAVALERLFVDYSIPCDHCSHVLDAIGQMPLGHLSSGIHRGEEDYVTLYYGATACNV